MSLPKDKIDKLADGLANDIKKVVREHYDNARKHEVGFEDAQQIVREGYRKAGEGKLSADSYFSEANNVAPGFPPRQGCE